MSESKSKLTSSFSDYDIFSMLSGLLLLGFSVILFAIIGINHYHNCHYISNQSEAELFSVIGALVFCVTMFASSYIEEEHQFWYFWIQTLWIVMFFRRYLFFIFYFRGNYSFCN